MLMLAALNRASDSLVRNLLGVFILAAGFLGSVAPLPKAWSPIEWVRGSGKLRRNSHPAFLGHRAQEPSTIACDLPRFANSRRAGHRLGDQGAWRLQRRGLIDGFVSGASDQYQCRDHGCLGATVPSRATLAAVLRSERAANRRQKLRRLSGYSLWQTRRRTALPVKRSKLDQATAKPRTTAPAGQRDAGEHRTKPATQ